MNYMQIVKHSDDSNRPCEVIQMFTNEEMIVLAEFVQDALDRDIYEPGRRAAFTLMNLLGQWEAKHL